MTKKYNKYFLSAIDYKHFILDLEEFIFHNETEFLKKFAKSPSCNLTKFSIYSGGAYIVYVLDSGQHIGDSIALEDLIIWIEEVNQNNFQL